MWEYVKGSEVDFEGAPEWARYVDTTESTATGRKYFSEGHSAGDRYVSSNQPDYVETHNGDKEDPIIIAERREMPTDLYGTPLDLLSDHFKAPRDEMATSLQSRVNDANLTEALTGLRVNYYLAQVKQPQREEQQPYQAECEDIIQALQMTFDEGCLFKALWRNAAARLNNGKPGQSSVYDAEKMTHYAARIHKWELSK